MQLHGERVGLIVFAGTAFVQSPLSADYEVLREFLGELDPSYLPQGGTDYEAMLNAAAQAFGAAGRRRPLSRRAQRRRGAPTRTGSRPCRR